MSARGYEFYLRVSNSISHERAQRTSEISNWTREDRIRIHKRTYNILFYINNNQLSNFPKISEHLPKIFENFSNKDFLKFRRTFPIVFRKLPKITEGCRIFASNLRRCFDHIEINLGSFNPTKLSTCKPDIFKCEDIEFMKWRCDHRSCIAIAWN